jgi:hypothetical protein
MLRTLLAGIAIALVTAAAPARADCSFTGDYYGQELESPCPVDPGAVPVGCPLHVLIAGPASSYPTEVTVLRGQTAIQLPATFTTVGTETIPFVAVDPVSCDCEDTTYTAAYTEATVDVPGVMDGDVVLTAGTDSGDSGEVSISGTGACPTPQWQATIDASIACDYCPEDPSGSDSPGSSKAAGCDAGGGATGLAIGLAALLVVSRRRGRTSHPASSRHARR